MVSGVAALLREVNPALTWRDLKLILAASARKIDSADTGWEAGARKYDSASASDVYHFNYEYGFGVVDAGAAVALARNWSLLPPFLDASSESSTLDTMIPDNTASGITHSLTLDTEIDFIEFVEVEVSIDHVNWRELKIEMVSPSGATSLLAVSDSTATDVPLSGKFRFGSAKHLGENPNGTWMLNVVDEESGNSGTFEDWSITVYGHGFDESEPPDAPGAPTVAATSGATDRLDVSWSAPDTTGRPAISDYDMQYRKSGDTAWTDHAHTGTSTMTTIGSLDSGTTYQVQVRATNAEGTSGWSATGTGSTDNSAPAFASDTTTRSVAENTASGANVGSAVTATDSDGDTLTYTLGGTDAASFDITSTSGQIQTSAALNYEAKASYSVTVSVTDGEGGTDTIAVSVTVTDVYDPNIVLVMADEGGYELFGAYGSTQYRTPRIDEIAAGGVRFTHAYSKPGSTPSRVALMTGKSNVRNYADWGTLLPGQYTIADLFSDAGYATAIAGKWQLQGRPTYITGVAAEESGFDTYCLWHSDISERRYWQPTFECDGQVIDYGSRHYGPDKLVDFLDGFIESNRDKPFFAYYSMLLPHAPFDALPPTSQCADADNAQCVFEDMVAYLDYNVGRIYDKLETLGLLGNTVFLFTSDNGTPESKVSHLGGEAIHGEKGMPTDGGTHVPLIVHAPGAAGGQVIGDLIDFTDFLPTLADAAGLTLPADVTVDGQSFWNRLQGGSVNPREWIYTYYFPDPYTDRWNFPREHPEVAYVRNKTFKLYASGDLYDLSADRHEVRPLAEDDEDSSAARAALQAVLDSMPEHGQEIRWDSVLTLPPGHRAAASVAPGPAFRDCQRGRTLSCLCGGPENPSESRSRRLFGGSGGNRAGGHVGVIDRGGGDADPRLRSDRRTDGDSELHAAVEETPSPHVSV